MQERHNICPSCINHNWPIPLPVLTGHTHCIFHEKSANKTNLNTLLLEAFAQITEPYKERSKNTPPLINLSGSIFTIPIIINRKTIPSLDFSHCTFEKELIIKNSTVTGVIYFNNAVFLGETSFNETKFNQTVKFDTAELHGKANFKKTKFGSDSSFQHTHFMEANFDNAEFAGPAYFRNCRFQSHTSFMSVYFLQGSWFTKSSFAKKADFTDATYMSESCFNDAIFYEDCKFENASLHNAQFINSIFNKNSNFKNASFNSNTIFTNARFGEMTTFKNSEFKGEAIFNSAKTGKNFIFEEATVVGDSSFKHTQFESKTNFSLCKLKSSVVLDSMGVLSKLSFNNAFLGTDETHTIKIYNVNVAGEINFSGSHFRGIFTIENTIIDGRLRLDHCRFSTAAIFRKSDIGCAEFQLTHFDEKPILDRVKLFRTNFFGAPVEDFRFISCSWPESHGRRIPHDTRKLDGNGFFEITSTGHPVQPLNSHETNPQKAAERIQNLEDLCRRLKKSAKSEQDEHLASDFHYAEKELQLAHALHLRAQNKNSLASAAAQRNTNIIATLWLYRLLSGYGESPERALFVLAIMLATPLIAIWLGDTFPTLNMDAFRLNAPGILNKFTYFSPLVKIPDPSVAGPGLRPLLAAYHILLTLQAALFGFALKNRFHR